MAENFETVRGRGGRGGRGGRIFVATLSPLVKTSFGQIYFLFILFI
jgi:hypothetical protein